MIADDGFWSVAVEVGFDGCNDLDFERLRDACPFPFKGAARAPNRRLRAVRVLRRSLPVIQAVLVEEIVEWLRVRALGGAVRQRREAVAPGAFGAFEGFALTKGLEFFVRHRVFLGFGVLRRPEEWML